MTCACLLAACTTSSAQPVAASVPEGNWSTSAAAPIVALNVHKTGQGYAGRATASDGTVWPIRNIAASETSLTFIVPGLDMSFSGEWNDAAKTWTSIVTGAETPVTLARGAAPAVAPPESPYSRPQQLVRLPDGREMNLYCLGKGSPAVILDYGAGGTSADWSDVHAAISATTRTCAYDRAGQGFSDPGPLPRDASAIVNDLRATLKAAGVTGPYILVGHSMGSLHVRLFANRHLKDVAGMVLVDPSGDFQNARIDKAVPAMAQTRGNNDGLRRCIAAARAGLVKKDSETFRLCRQNDPDLMESRVSEAESMQTLSSEQTTASRRSYGDLPLIVLTRGDNSGGPPQLTQADLDAFYEAWKQMHEEFAELSTAGIHRIVPNAKHYIQRDKPEAVIAAVNEVVAEARRRTR